ncbi:MAG: trimethylamine methyltransferase family protein, partial [Myxococcales bacterium]|nr:trimethylamine methyltransferase family protein [Myxococcales bacterium]
MVDVHPRSGNTPPYDPLPEAAARRIVDAALAILRETGVQFDADPELLDLFAGAGCDVSAAGLVKFDADCVRAALDSVAKSVTLWNRAGTESIGMRDGN